MKLKDLTIVQKIILGLGTLVLAIRSCSPITYRLAGRGAGSRTDFGGTFLQCLGIIAVTAFLVFIFAKRKKNGGSE